MIAKPVHKSSIDKCCCNRGSLIAWLRSWFCPGRQKLRVRLGPDLRGAARTVHGCLLGGLKGSATKGQFRQCSSTVFPNYGPKQTRQGWATRLWNPQANLFRIDTLPWTLNIPSGLARCRRAVCGARAAEFKAPWVGHTSSAKRICRIWDAGLSKRQDSHCNC